MHIPQYIVTYNNPFQLNEGLASLFANTSDEERSLLEVFVINNHSSFELRPEFESRVTVLHNVLRPDFSTGHLARNWNQALINGFGNLLNPACDIVITNQDDTRFSSNYINQVIELHTRFDLIQFGWGDNFISYTPTAVKVVGLWDERFCSIGYQEADYLLRAMIFLKDRASINDPSHRRLHNTQTQSPIQVIASGINRGEDYTKAATEYHSYNRALFLQKWGFDPDPGMSEPFDALRPLIPAYILYPYFEKHILTLEQQNYFRGGSGALGLPGIL